MLELRPNCEMCDCDLPPQDTRARICSYECTFCADCVESRLENVCPNCGGGFVQRPIRPETAWREGVSRTHQPPGDTRRFIKHDADSIAALTARARETPPEHR